MTKRTCSIILLIGMLAFAFGFLFVGCGPLPAPAPDPVVNPPIVKPPLPPPDPTPTPPPTPSPAGIQQQLLDAHNEQRANAGLTPLVVSPKLQAAAQGHSDYQAKVERMAHEGIGDGTPFTRMQADGYSFSSAGENIAWNQQTVAAVMAAWMNDPGHRANILGNYKEVGLAVTDLYWTVDFGTAMQRGAGEIHIISSTAPVVTSGVNSAASSTTTTTPGAP